MNPLTLVGGGVAALLLYLYSQSAPGGASTGQFTPIGQLGFSPQVMRWKQEARQVSAKTGVPAPLILSMIKHESAGQPDAIGDAGYSHGLMQLRINPDDEISPAVETVRRRTSLPYKDPREMTATENIRYGTEYLRLMTSDLGGSFYDGIRAYLCGPGTAKANTSCGSREATERVSDAGGQREQ